jgi:hypothetical protein
LDAGVFVESKEVCAAGWRRDVWFLGGSDARQKDEYAQKE